MGLYGPGGTGNDPAGSVNSSGNATGSGGGYDGSGGGGNFNSHGYYDSYGGMISVNTPDDVSVPGFTSGYGGDYESGHYSGDGNNSTDWGLVGQAASLGMAVLGLPGAVMGGLLGWGLQQGAFTGQSAAVAEQTADMNSDGNDGGARTLTSSEPSQEAAVSDTSGESSEASESTDAQQVTDAANQAEEQERKRQRYGYMESISGEESVEMSMLWNPNISAMGTPGFVY